MFMNCRIRLSARATPSTPRTRSTVVSGKLWAKSTFGVWWEVTQMSALECSIVVVALSSRPMNRPTRTSTSVTADATPATVITKRSRSWSRFLRARDTMGLVLLVGRREEAADAGLDHLIDEVRRRGAVGKPLRVVGDEQGDDAVQPRPEHLGHRQGSAPAEAAVRDRPRDRGEKQVEGPLARFAQLVVVGRIELERRHEHVTVVVGVFEAEPRVGAAHLADLLDRVRRQLAAQQ